VQFDGELTGIRTRLAAGRPWRSAVSTLSERGYMKNKFPGELYNLHDDLAQRRNLYFSDNSWFAPRVAFVQVYPSNEPFAFSVIRFGPRR
jgi:hypothetical protein